MPRQNAWRWCHKCEGLFFSGNPSQGACPSPGGGPHDASQSGHYAMHLGDAVPGAQSNWRWCRKCQGLFFVGNPSQGVCPAGGSHDANESGHYSLVLGDQAPGTQGGWRYCQKCEGLFFSGNPDQGACPKGGTHDSTASGQYGMPWETGRLNDIVLQYAPIVFGGGVPVGGWSNLSAHPDGSYDFSGHFHDSGAASYNVSIVWVLNSSAGTAFTFATSGEGHGTFEPGSRDYDWDVPGNNAALAAAWDDLSAGYVSKATASASIDIAGLWSEIKTAVGVIEQVVAVVGPLFA